MNNIIPLKEKACNKNQWFITNVLQFDMLTDVKEEQIVREKQLCSDYEERMADQVSVCSLFSFHFQI